MKKPYEDEIEQALAFDKGLRGADNDPDSAFQHQPSPEAMAQLTDNTRQNSPEMSDVPLPNEGGSMASAENPTMGRPLSKISVDTLRKGDEILRKYKTGKKTLEDKIVKNERWWKIRHWEMLSNEDNRDDPKPASAWLFNTIISKHADYMDSYPTADILPREQGDVDEAKRLSSIIPVVLQQNEFRQIYSEEVWYKLKHGTGVYGVFWDGSKLNGLGDIQIESMDILSMFWEPGITDIQESRNLFTVELVDNDILREKYPQVTDKLSKSSDTLVKKYWHDDSIDTTNKSAVIDWYYHKTINGKKTLQYIKYTNDIVLYATEEDPNLAERGLYDHGKYPFVFDVLFPEVDMPCGFGFVDVCKNAQTTIDIYNNCFEKNLQFAASPRYMCRNDGGINEEEFSNPNNLLVHTNGNLGEDSIKPIVAPTLVNSNYLNLLDQKINEMKETAGNRDATTGGTQAGVTAASAIAAMQESAGKTSRDQISSSYDAYKKVVDIVIELIRQFYDMPRQFRIIGEQGQQEFTTYTNMGLQPQYQGLEFGVDMGYRLPVFDIEVKTEKESAYTQMSQNELALDFYNRGFFNPQFSDQALACIDMMEFKGKNMMIDKIQQNGGMYQQLMQVEQMLLQMAEMVDQMSGGQTQMSDQVADMINNGMAQGTPMTGGNIDLSGGESSITAKARERAQSVNVPK